MKVTNEMGLPKAFKLAVNTERHNKAGCYSATTLLHGSKETILSERHYEEMETDVADNVWSIWGTAVHSIFEKVNDETFKEVDLQTEVEGVTVTGRVDNYDMQNEILVDWKTASAWKVIYKDFKDWKKQGLIYAWLMKKNGMKVKKCRFIALLKDHSKTEAKRKPEYPQKPVYIYEFEVTDEDLQEIEKFIFNKVKELKAFNDLLDDEIPECTCEERWATSDKFAVMKTGRKTAVKVCETKEEAINIVAGKKDFYLEERKGENKKCNDYCPCAEFCHFYKSLNK